MAVHVSFTLDDSLAEQARRFGVDLSAAAQDGVAAAVRAELARHDRGAYANNPEEGDSGWTAAESWSEVDPASLRRDIEAVIYPDR